MARARGREQRRPAILRSSQRRSPPPHRVSSAARTGRARKPLATPGPMRAASRQLGDTCLVLGLQASAMVSQELRNVQVARERSAAQRCPAMLRRRHTRHGTQRRVAPVLSAATPRTCPAAGCAPQTQRAPSQPSRLGHRWPPAATPRRNRRLLLPRTSRVRPQRAKRSLPSGSRVARGRTLA